MTPWYAPPNIKIWRRRLITPRSVVLTMLVLAIAATELRFDWMEQAVGAYLVTTNAHRPKSGTIWEQGLQADTARAELTQYADQRQNLQRQVREAESFAQLLAGLDAGKGAMISADHFLALYLKLPPVLANEIISPFVLLTYANTGQWQRTFLENQDRQVQVYMLDGQSQVVHRLAIGADLVGYIERGEVAVRAGLDQLADFANHIYDAEYFFTTLNTLPEELRTRVVPHPESLLRITGRIRRVGISENRLGNAVDVGFEVEDMEGRKVILVQGMAEAVRRLQRTLDGRTGPGWPWDAQELQ